MRNYLYNNIQQEAVESSVTHTWYYVLSQSSCWLNDQEPDKKVEIAAFRPPRPRTFWVAQMSVALNSSK